MKLEHYPQEKLRQELLRILGKYLDLDKYKVFFFGSRVSGKASDRADIDIGIEGPRPLPAAIRIAIQEELDNLPTLYTLELVDFARVDEQFKKQAKKQIEYVK